MKRVSKLLSVILVFALCFGLSSPALAMSIEPAPTAVSSTDTVLEETGGSILVLRSEDLSNGDARISMLKNDIVVSSTYVDRSASQVAWQEYEDGQVVEQEVRSVPQVVQVPSISPQATSWNIVGDVRYNHYVQSALGAITRITWSYTSHTDPSVDYNINGRFQDITMLASILLAVFSFGSSLTATAIASKIWAIMKAIDAANTANDLFLEDYYVECVKETVIWRATASGKEKTYEGYNYTVTHSVDGVREGQSQREGFYYPTTAIADHNTSLALKPYGYFFKGYNKVTIHSWPV